MPVGLRNSAGRTHHFAPILLILDGLDRGKWLKPRTERHSRELAANGPAVLAEKTVKHYMTNILQKLHVRSRVEAALLAQRRELRGG